MAAEGGPFAVLRLSGDRFDNARLPVDALVELQRYQTMILAAAISAWQAEHPSEVLPDDFEDSFDLTIVRVDDGSAAPVLERSPSQYDSYFDSGRDDVESALEALWQGAEDIDLVVDAIVDPIDTRLISAANDRVAVYRPLAAVADTPAFRDFGSSLQEGDSLQVSDDPVDPRLTLAVRASRIVPLFERVEDRRLQQVPAPRDAPRRRYGKGTIAGRLHALNADSQSFDMSSLAFGKLHGRYKNNPSAQADLKAVLDSSAMAPVIRVTGRLSFLGEYVTQVLGVDSVELFEVSGEPWSRRLIELASLGPNWSDEDDNSLMVSFSALDAVRDILRLTSEITDRVPGIFPRADGGVAVEWSSPDRMTSIEIGPDRSFFVHDLVVASRQVEELETTDLVDAVTALLGALQ